MAEKITSMEQVKTILQRMLDMIESDSEDEEPEEDKPEETDTEDKSEDDTEEETEKCSMCGVIEKSQNILIDNISKRRICYLCLSSNF